MERKANEKPFDIGLMTGGHGSKLYGVKMRKLYGIEAKIKLNEWGYALYDYMDMMLRQDERQGMRTGNPIGHDIKEDNGYIYIRIVCGTWQDALVACERYTELFAIRFRVVKVEPIQEEEE